MRMLCRARRNAVARLSSFRLTAMRGIFVRMIPIKDVLEKMHSGEAFSLKVVTYDRRRRAKSGKIVEYPEARLVWGDGGTGRARKNERAPTALELALSGAGVEDKRSPNHAGWYTRNIRLYQNGLETEAIRKIHPPLIIEFNGEMTCP